MIKLSNTEAKLKTNVAYEKMRVLRWLLDNTSPYWHYFANIYDQAFIDR